MSLHNLHKTRFVTASGESINNNRAVPAGDVKDGKLRLSAYPAVNENGEINAPNARAALGVATAMLRQKTQGGIIRDPTDLNMASTMDPAQREKVHQRVVTAMANPNSPEYARLGTDLANRVRTTIDRDGKLPAILKDDSENIDSRGQHIVSWDDMDIRARPVSGTGSGSVGGEIYLTNNNKQSGYTTIRTTIRSPLSETIFDGAAFMDVKFQQALQAIMVEEDRHLRDLSLQSALQPNIPVTFSGLMTPTVLATMAEVLTSTFRDIATFLMSSNFLIDLNTAPEWTNRFEPITQADLILTGRIARAMGGTIMIEPYNHPNLSVLQKREIFAYAAPERTGCYALPPNNPISKPTNGFSDSEGWQGWFLQEFISIFLFPAAVVVAAGT